jgi:aspartyl-tRNA(Asn)/glutamyl-tRNA(Gln) amidotransferase subunit A
MSISTEPMSQQVSDLNRGSRTALSLAEHVVQAARAQSHLNAFAALDEQRVLTQATASDKRRREGRALSVLDGVPIAVKDNYLTRDYPTTACSRALRLETGEDATIVARLRAAGAVIVGKTNMHELAYGATNTTSTAGATRNPLNPAHITGGSSGGSAVAVAGGIVSASLGSDTGGSVRIPSAACGIYGFKPTYGRASRHGIVPLSWSLDAPGPMAASLEDIELLLPHFLGEDERDATTHRAASFAALPAVRRPRLVHLSGPGLERSEEVDEAVRRALGRLDAETREAELPGMTSYFGAWETIMHCEASSFHNALLQRSPELFSTETRIHLVAGTKVTAMEFLAAQKLRAQLLRELLKNMGEWDALVVPTLPVTAPEHGVERQRFGGRDVSTQDAMTWFCWLGNLAGLPCVTIPVPGSPGRLPTGMMLMGKPGRDEELLAIAKLVDQQIS